MADKFFGRADLVQELKSLWRKHAASLVTCRGRRRIGKSTLISRFAQQSSAQLFDFEGLPPQPRMTNADQLECFARRLAELTDAPYEPIESWFDAFKRLDTAIPSEPCVVLLDEISWMGKYDPNFPGDLKFAWDKRFHSHQDLIVVICGSVSSWIEENILENTGFVGRVSLDLTVPELSLKESSHFWDDVRDRIADTEILDLLSITGGVPRYLEEIDPSQSADENIRRMCFRPNGYLYRDFDDIFSSLFAANSNLKRKILNQLAQSSVDAGELAQTLGIARNGQFTKTMRELEMAGFVATDHSVNPTTGKRAKAVRYRLRDNYTRFFLKYVKSHAAEIQDGHYSFVSLENLPGWQTVKGLQFENLVLNNFSSLITPLHLDGVQIFSAAPYSRHADDTRRGVQIDLLVQTRKSYVVVEIKHQAEVKESVEEEVREKIRRLGIPSDRSVRTALVYSGRLSKAVSGNGFFDAIIPASALLTA